MAVWWCLAWFCCWGHHRPPYRPLASGPRGAGGFTRLGRDLCRHDGAHESGDVGRGGIAIHLILSLGLYAECLAYVLPELYRALALAGAQILEVFRQGDEPRTPGCGLVGKGHGGRDVDGDVVTRIELDEGDGQGHGAIVRRRQDE